MAARGDRNKLMTILDPSWLRIEPMTVCVLFDHPACSIQLVAQGIIPPNGIAEITFTVFVDNSTAPKLNREEKVVKSTVILHSLLGKDQFISITGEYRRFAHLERNNLIDVLEYTCFATSLERLTRLTDSARALKSPHDYLPEGHAKNAPREVMRLVNWMMTGSARIVCQGASCSTRADFKRIIYSSHLAKRFISIPSGRCASDLFLHIELFQSCLVP